MIIKYDIYIKLLSNGMPDDFVKRKMILDGLKKKDVSNFFKNVRENGSCSEQKNITNHDFRRRTRSLSISQSNFDFIQLIQEEKIEVLAHNSEIFVSRPRLFQQLNIRRKSFQDLDRNKNPVTYVYANEFENRIDETSKTLGILSVFPPPSTISVNSKSIKESGADIFSICNHFRDLLSLTNVQATNDTKSRCNTLSSTLSEVSDKDSMDAVDSNKSSPDRNSKESIINVKIKETTFGKRRQSFNFNFLTSVKSALAFTSTKSITNKSEIRMCKKDESDFFSLVPSAIVDVNEHKTLSIKSNKGTFNIKRSKAPTSLKII